MKLKGACVCGLGTYSLRLEFIPLQCLQDEMITLKAYSPAEIVQRIRNEVTMKTVNSKEEIYLILTQMWKPKVIILLWSYKTFELSMLVAIVIT